MMQPGISKPDLIRLLQTRLRIGPVRIYNRQPTDPQAQSWKWPNRTEALEPANHAKVMVFGDKGFYIGSDNAYAMPFNPFGMQEFGHMVEGQQETHLLLAQYVKIAWYYSAQFQVTDWSRIVDQTTEGSEEAPRVHIS